MALKSVLKGDARVREAAGKPFQSMQLGLDTGRFAVTLVQTSLKRIELDSPKLPAQLRPRLKFDDDTRSGLQWGPFFIPDDERRGRIYGGDTHTAVVRFQRQAGLAIDGKAGINTLARLDEVLHFVETH
jgi:hypothetical protein